MRLETNARDAGESSRRLFTNRFVRCKSPRRIFRFYRSRAIRSRWSPESRSRVQRNAEIDDTRANSHLPVSVTVNMSRFRGE